jgi:hypothetical protein
VLGQHAVDERLVAHAAAARFRAELRQDLGVEPDGDQAINRRAVSLRGGRPTRRMARSWLSKASGTSLKSILRGVRRAYTPARASRADTADRFDIGSSPESMTTNASRQHGMKGAT